MLRYIPLLLAAAAPALAQTVEIINFIGTVEIVEGSGLSISGERDGTAELRGSSLVVDGGEQTKSLNCRVNNDRVRVGRRGKLKPLGDYPMLRITAPASTAFVVRDSVVFGSASDLADVDFESRSCGRFAFGDVSGTFTVSQSGSGRITAGDVGKASLRTSGSGDFEISDSETLSFSSSGSGDIAARAVTGPAILRSSGSGDAVVTSVGGGLEFRSSGSGDLLLGRLDGPAELSSTGSGDVTIDAGEITSLDGRTTGSGDVDIGASVGDADLRSTGSGDFRLRSVSGRLEHRSTGSGSVVVGGDRVKRR